jgi:hypothetical protein
MLQFFGGREGEQRVGIAAKRIPDDLEAVGSGC